MIKEIQTISNKLIELNSSVYNTILSKEEVHFLRENLAIIQKIQKNIPPILHEASLIPPTNTNEIAKVLIKIHQLLVELGSATETIYELSRKFVRNYREEWNTIKTNQA